MQNENKELLNVILTGEQFRQLVQPKDPSNFEKTKLGLYVVSLALSLFLVLELWDLKRENSNRIAYESATANVMNRYIGHLEGKNSKEFRDFADIIKTMKWEIETETNKKIKEY